MKLKTIYQKLIFLLLLAISFNTKAQELQLLLAKAITGTNRVTCYNIEADNLGNIYVSGFFSGTVDFDLGPGIANLTTGVGAVLGSSFIAKYDAQGNYIFAKSLGGNGSGIINITTMVLDKLGNICISGTFISTADFDPSAAVANFTSVGSFDIYIAKYNANGMYVNAWTLGNSDFNSPKSISTDANNNLIMIGDFNDTIDFDPSPATVNLISNSNVEDIFVAKYSENGVLLHAFKLGGSDENSSQSIIADPSGNFYVSGDFFTTIDLDPGPAQALFSSVGGKDGFWAKYDLNGNYISGNAYDGGVNFMELDQNGNFYFSGRLPDSMDVDPGPNVAMLYSFNNFDIFIVKLDPAGNYLNGKAFESNLIYTQYGIISNSLNEIYMYGKFQDTVNFNPGSSSGILTSNGLLDAFITKSDANGNFKLAYSLGNSASNNIEDLAVDPQGNIWICGIFLDTLDFDFGLSVSNLISPDYTGVYLAKYRDKQVVGISQPKQSPKEIKVYSSLHNIYIDFTALEKVNSTIQIINMLGQTVAEATHRNNDMLKISLSNLPNQMYTVVVKNENKVTVKKVWVSR